jgi:hypothetical protein
MSCQGDTVKRRWSSDGGWRRPGVCGRVALAGVVGALTWTAVAGGTQPYETYEGTVAGDGPVAQFRFDDAVGSSTIADSAGSYTATNDGIVLGGEGPFGGSKSGSFDGEAYAALPADPLAGASAFTVEAWVDWAGDSASKQPVFALGSSSSNYMYLTPASALTSHMMLFEIHTSGGSDVQVVAPKMAANVWRYLTVTETSEGTLTLYVDGEQLRQSTGVSLFPSSLGSAPDAYLGRSVGGEVLFGGLLSNVAFYTKALSASEVKAHWDAGEFPVDTVLPAISGTAKDGSALSATKGTWTGLTPITFAYQWTLCNSSGESCASIPGASEAKYTLGDEDVGGTLRTVVTASNGAGSGTATSAQSTLVAPLAPSNTALPAISGAAEQGQLLSASEGTWKGTPPLSYTYQWEQCNSTGGACKKITGATASTYRVPGSLIGDTLRVVVTAENAAGSKSATSEATAVITTGPPVNTTLPAVSGTAEDGHTLSASTGSWAGTEPFSYTYQWELCNSVGESCANISGATASTYALGPGDVGDTLRVLVTAKNSVSSTGASSAPSGVVAAIPPSNTAAPTITGSAVDSHTLTATTGSWSGSPPLSYAYQWELCNGSGESCANISGATSSTYLLGHGDVGSTLRVKVTASNPGGSVSSTSSATGVVTALAPSNTSLPSISGTAQDGQTLSASTGSWEGTPTISYTYQWQTCNSSGENCANISGATSSTYALEHGDVGDTLRVVVTASNAGGSTPATSGASGVVTALAPSNTTAPSISGTAEEGQTLSASTGSWEGTQPITYTYQWESCNSMGEGCLDIAGATVSSHTLGAGEVGETLRVVVTATNVAGSASATSTASGVVTVPTPPSYTALPVISGATEEGKTLSATSGSWEGTQPLGYSYQWESCNASGAECADIEGAAEVTYLLGPGAVGSTMRVLVTASNEEGALSVVSAPSAVVGSQATLPVNLVAPEVSGTSEQGQTLSASPGTWAGPAPLAYSYQWESCNGTGESCADVEGASEPTYQLGAGDVGSTLRVVVTASSGSARASRISPASAVVAGVSPPESICTDTWEGPSEGEWQEAENWSNGAVPTASDVACLPAGSNVVSGLASDRVGVLRDEGELTFYSGSLEVMSTSELSTVATLNLYNDNPDIAGPGTLQVTGHLEWVVGEMLGSGRTVIGPSATATLGLTPYTGVVKERTLVNEGTLTFSQGELSMYKGALLENDGTFADNSQSCEHCEGVPGQIYALSGSGATPMIVNVGTFEKTQGTGTGTVAVNFGNEGTVSALTGTLKFLDGGIPGQAATGSWSVAGSGAVVFAGGVFAVGESVALGAVHIEAGATVERAPAPASSSQPSISGAPQAGQTLSAQPGSWSGSQPITYSYRWQRCNASGSECGSIAGADSQDYTVASGEIGAAIRVLVTASNSYGKAVAPSPVSPSIEAPPAPSNTSLPTVSGSARDGQTLSAGTGEWDGVAPVSYAYQWESCNPSGGECAPIENATSAEYALTEGDVGTTLRVLVTATNPGGSTQAGSLVSTVVQAEAPSELQAPSVTGTPEVHEVLHAEPGVWTGTETELSYQWESCSEAGGECAPVEGATSPEYDLAEGDLSTTLRVRVGVHSAIDSLSDVSPVTPVIGADGALAGTQPPTISGSAQAGQALTASEGAWSGASGTIAYTYQWQSCDELDGDCQNIENATSSSYVPVSGDVGQRLRVALTATDEEHHSATQISASTLPVAGAQAPVAEQAPPIIGPALVGQTLIAGTGVFAGEGPISYTYQWERCTTPASCHAIEGATQGSYTLTEHDLGATVLALVNATDASANTTTVSPPTAPVGSEPLTELSGPSIAGVVQPEGTLSADPGIWSAIGTVSYTYQWQTCNHDGTECAAIEDATEPTYTISPSQHDLTLRVEVTVTSPLGSKTAVSAPTSVSPGGEVSIAEAQETLQRTDPAVLAPATTATLEEQSIAPALNEAEEELAAQSTLTSSTISKETAGEFAVNTPVGELSVAPVESSSHAATLPTIVNGAAALFANTWPATDTIVRPEPLGATTLLQIRSPEAPHTFSWELRLGPDLELQQLPDGSVAVIEAPEEPAEPSNGQESTEAPSLKDTSEGPAETSEEKTEAEQAEAEPETEEEAPLETLPSAPKTEATPGEASPGKPQPQQTQASYETATSTMASAETQTGGNTLLVITPPTVTDAEGHTVPATLTTLGNTITANIKPAADAAWPLLADFAIAAHNDKDSAAHKIVRYGISDPDSEAKGHIDEHFNEKGEVVAKFDPNLFDGPRNTPRHTRTARLIVPYDTLVKTAPEGAKHKQALEDWLRKVKKQGLEPYITLGQNYAKKGPDPCSLASKATSEEKKCEQPSVEEYKKAVAKLMEEVIGWHRSRHWPLVKLWGAWNEPDATSDPLHKDKPRAAQFWEIARSILQEITHHSSCSGCTVIAGEFSTYYPEYTSCYRNVIFYGYCRKTNHTHYYTRYWFGKPKDPTAWGFHDYGDLLHRDNHTASEFAKFARKRLNKPRLFMSEAGVELQAGGETETELGELKAKTEAEKASKRELQQKASEEFLNLPEGLSYPINRMNYYEYTAPTEKAQKKHVFDSGLLEVEGRHRRERPAYCVLAYEKHVCPPTSEAESTSIFVGLRACGTPPKMAKIVGHINPNGAKTVSYHFEYGPTSAYGESTPAENIKPEAGWALAEVRAEIPVTKLEETERGMCPSPIHFRLAATNAQGTRKSTDQTVTFTVII